MHDEAQQIQDKIEGDSPCGSMAWSTEITNKNGCEDREAVDGGKKCEGGREGGRGATEGPTERSSDAAISCSGNSKILSAVPMPSSWILPCSRHFWQEMQSIT